MGSASAVVVLLAVVVGAGSSALSEGEADTRAVAGSKQPGETPASSSESADPRERYIDYLERAVHRQATRAERNERKLAHARVVFRRSLGTSPLGNHWLEDAFTCIHHHEGRWTDSGDPYWGGLQMDWSFMRAYGGEYLRAFGPANHWPRSVQVAVAIKAYLSRGFGPWPNTRKACGL